jgi:multiple sugar transport system permease protein
LDEKPVTRKKLRARLRRSIVYGALVLAALYSTWPIFRMALAGYDISFFSIVYYGLLHRGPTILYAGPYPFRSGPTNYLDALMPNAFPARMENSVGIAAISISIALAAGVTVAYALARLPIRGKGAISYALLALRALFPVAIAAPLYVIFTRDGLLDSYVAVAIGEELVVLPVVIWMLRGFFTDIPRDIYDVAAAFGATEGQIFRRVALRMVIPGIAVTSLFAFILIWNEFAIANILTGSLTKTATVGVWTGFAEIRLRVIRFDALNAAGFLAWIPAIALTLAIRRYLAKGYSLGTASSNA